MTVISKNIDKDVKVRENIGFDRPAADIKEKKYNARVVKRKSDGESFVFFDFIGTKKVQSWGIPAMDLLGLEHNPVDEKNNRLVQDEGWVGTVPADKKLPVVFRVAG